MKTIVLTAGLAGVITAAPRAALADGAAIDVNRFHPALGSQAILTTELASVGPHLELVPQLFVHFADQPLVFTVGDEYRSDVVRNRLTTELGIALSLRNRFQIGVSFPVTLMQDGEPVSFDPVFDGMDPVNPPENLSSRGAEDLRLSIKGLLWRNGDIALGASGVVGVPTGDADSYLSSGFPWLDARLLAHHRSGRLTTGFNVGWLFATQQQVFATRTGMALTFGGGVEYQVYRKPSATDAAADISVGLAAEVFGLAHSRFDSLRETPVELLGAVKANVRHWTFFVGAGPGLTRGYGEPNVRALAGMSYRWKPSPRPPRPPEPPLPVDDKPPVVEPPPVPERPKRDWEGDIRELEADVLFDFGKCAISPRSFGELRKLADEFKAHPEWGNVRVEGHADSVDTDKLNLHLSRCRASRVVRFLVYQGVQPERLSYVGFGERCPRGPNDTPDSRLRNRRVEFVRNQENNPPRCEIPPQLEPLPQHKSEPEIFREGDGVAPQPAPGARPRQPAAPAQPAPGAGTGIRPQ